MLDVSPELIFIPWHGGVKLCKSSLSQHQQIRVSNVLKLPFNIYFLDHQSKHKALNESEADIMGFDSIKSTLNKSAVDISDSKTGSVIRENDLTLLKTGRSTIIEEVLRRTDNENFRTLSFKYPIYNDQNKINGIFGCSIILGCHKLADSLFQMREVGLFFPMQSILNMNSDVPTLTQRQIECLVLLIKGKTIKQIAQALHLSPKTIEHYLRALRVKLDCSSRSQLIYKASQIQVVKDQLA